MGSHMQSLKAKASAGLAWPVAVFGLIAATVAGWITHIVVTIQYLVGGGDSIAYAALLVVGAFMAPVGVIHGWGIWFGAW